MYVVGISVATALNARSLYIRDYDSEYAWFVYPWLQQ